MEKQELDVFSSASNVAVVRAPGRRFPGVIVQGDTLHSLLSLARSIADSVADSTNEDLVGESVALRDRLAGLLDHYTAVLDAHEHPLPFNRGV